MAHSFALIPWDRDFLFELFFYLEENTDIMGDAVLIFPHQRPKRYFLDMVRRNECIHKPCLLPRLLAVDELFQLWRLERSSYHNIDMLEQVALLFECTQQAAKIQKGHEYTIQSLAEQLADMDMAHFFPWGVQLGQLLDESFSQNCLLEDILYAENVSPFAAALLGSLSAIRRLYMQELETRKWTSPAYDAFCVVNALHEGLPSFLEKRPVFIAGFTALTGCEERLFHHLWTHDAFVCIHADPLLAYAATGHTKQQGTLLVADETIAANAGKKSRSESRRAHWASALHRQWLQKWKADVAYFCTDPSAEIHEPHIHFFAGHDLHSQLVPLSRNLETFVSKTVDASALVLSSTALLMPTLHQIAGRDVNISMGYPLERAPLFQLFESIMRLHENSRNGHAYWKDALELVRHPLLRMLEIEGIPLRGLLTEFENKIHEGLRLVDCLDLWKSSVAQGLGSREWAEGSARSRGIEQAHLLGSLLFEIWADIESPAGLASALSALCLFLLEHDRSAGGSLWKRFPLDAEILYRLVQKTIPPLQSSSLAHQIFPQNMLFRLLREMARAERVPFEADPITGLQVLGILETRLLHFQHVHLLDSTDDVLPGSDGQNPLLPEPLRKLLGLPTSHERELVAAYTLHSLIAGAEEVFFYWQEGMEAEGRKLRSRYIEEFIWEQEQQVGHILHTGDGSIQTVSGTLHPFSKKRRSIEKTPSIQSRMEELLKGPLSPTRLDAYLQCPARFFYQYLAQINPVDTVHEGDDPSAVGTLLHEVLQRFYTPFIGQKIHRDVLNAAELMRIFDAELGQSLLHESLPPDSLMMLRVAAKEHLSRFLQAHVDEFEIICLEKKLTSSIAFGKKNCILTGKVDRVDKRADSLCILDYKTGKIPDYKEKIWSLSALWDNMECWTPQSIDPLPDLAQTLCSVQLPLYLFVWNTEHPHDNARQAAWVTLADQGDEKMLFSSKCAEDVRSESIHTHIPALLRFMLRHMDETPVFQPQEGTQCQWCAYRNACNA